MPPPVRPSTSPDGTEKRRAPRADLHILVQFRFNTFEEFLAEYSLDISVGGMFLRTESPRAEGSMIYLQFALRDGSKLIEGLGKVVRVNPPGGGKPAGMGVEFVNLDEDSRGLIEDIVAQKLPPQPG
jgi:type IV pilus assembly protein PilZ